MTEYFQRRVPAGESINRWLILGPIYEDLSEQVIGLSLFERLGASVGRTAMNEIVAEAQGVLRGTYREGDQTGFRGQTAQWNLVRRPDQYLSWGTYNISNHLGAVFLTTLLTPDEAGSRRWTFRNLMSERALVAINGEVVWDNGAVPLERTSGLTEYNFEAALQTGENVVTVALFRLARMAQVGCFLALDADVQARLEPGLPLDTRTRIEESVRSVRLERDVFYPDHAMGFTLGVGPGDYSVKAELIAPDGDKLIEINDVKTGSVVLREAITNGHGPLSLGNGADVPDGAYQIRCHWMDANGQTITETSYDIRVVTPVAPMPGYEHTAERKRIALEHFTHETGGD